MPEARETPQNPLHERYASAEMARLFSARHRFRSWRRLWICLAENQAALGLPISGQQLDALREHADDLDLERVAALERETRHDVVAHLRHFAEVSGDAGSILHLGATSAFITDNTDALIVREALDLVAGRLAATVAALADFARRERATTALAYTHFQSAQLTTLGKRACLWLQDFLTDLEEVADRRDRLRCRGAKGTTGTQASFLTLFGGDHGKVRQLDARVASDLGFEASWRITGQTYPRKQDSQVLHTLSGTAESCHKFGSDLRLLQGVGELSEPFDENQVGSSAMAYKRNPVRAERMCSLSRRVMSDSLHGALNAGTQWLERSLDDSANRRLVLTDCFLTVDAVLLLAANIAQGLRVNEAATAARVTRELPFMATETFLMEASLRGGDRQELHERIRRHSLEAYARVSAGEPNPLIDLIAGDPAFGLGSDELESLVDADSFTGRSAQQVDEFLGEAVEPALARHRAAAVEAPRV
ncbi:MAG: adenylosuccinate lyase [Acidobacteria bacterium]|nr:adenylosuccinate lyase [Acidobacteriota bacterium]MYJ25227.1 adenylosuccinate lyase [Holophagales bacterium]